MEINWLLIGVIAVVVSCVYHGYRCGLVRILFSIATFVITVIIVRLLAPVGVQMLKNNDTVYESIKAPIEKVLDEKIDGQVTTEEVLDSCQISQDVKKDILNAAEDFGMTTLDIFTPKLRNITADCITLRVIDLLAYILLFMIINIGLRVVGIILDRLSKLPGVHGANQLAGGLFGVLEGIAFVWIFFVFVTIFSTSEWGSWCFERIGDSTLLSFLYAQNIFIIFV